MAVITGKIWGVFSEHSPNWAWIKYVIIRESLVAASQDPDRKDQIDID